MSIAAPETATSASGTPDSPERKAPKSYAKTPGMLHFWLRRLHSLMGVLFGGYVTIHLLVNFTGFWPLTFQRNVDKIHSLEPWLPLIELITIFIPLTFHVVYGIYIAKAGVKYNPIRYNYGGNLRHVLQRVTAILLLAFLVYHIGTLHKWGFVLLNKFVPTPQAAIDKQKEMDTIKDKYKKAREKEIEKSANPDAEELTASQVAVLKQYRALKSERDKALDAVKIYPAADFDAQNSAYQSTASAIKSPYFKKVARIDKKTGEVIKDAKGNVMYESVPDDFKNNLVKAGYLIGILAAVFHWANGMWTAAITWGLTVTARAQKLWGHACLGFGIFMLVIGAGAWTAFAVCGDPTYDYEKTTTIDTSKELPHMEEE